MKSGGALTTRVYPYNEEDGTLGDALGTAAALSLDGNTCSS
jgi:hypothetical protein